MRLRTLAILVLLASVHAPPSWAQARWAAEGGRPWILKPRYDEKVSGDVHVRIRPLGVEARITLRAWDVGGGGERELSGGGLGRTRPASDELRIPRAVFKGVSRAALMVCLRGADRLDRSRCSRVIQIDLVGSPTGVGAGGPPGAIRSLRIEAREAAGFAVRVSGTGICDELELTACHRVAGSEVCTRETHRGYDLEQSPSLTAGASMPGLASVRVGPGSGANACAGGAEAEVGTP